MVKVYMDVFINFRINAGKRYDQRPDCAVQQLQPTTIKKLAVGNHVERNRVFGDKPYITIEPWMHRRLTVTGDYTSEHILFREPLQNLAKGMLGHSQGGWNKFPRAHHAGGVALAGPFKINRSTVHSNNFHAWNMFRTVGNHLFYINHHGTGGIGKKFPELTFIMD